MALWHPLVDLTVSTLGLYDDARYPGRCLLVLHEHVEDMTSMPNDLACALLGDARRAGFAIQQAVQADRINYAVLGNVVPHMHYHLVPRRWQIDPAPGLSPWQTSEPVRPLPSADRRVIEESIIARLADLDEQAARRYVHNPRPHHPSKEDLMTASLTEPGNIERDLAERLEKRAKEIIGQRERGDVAKELGIAPSGVDALLWQDDWSIERALRVLEALGALPEKAAESLMSNVA